MNATSILPDVLGVVRVESDRLKTDNLSAQRSTFTLRGFLFFSPAALIKRLSDTVGQIVAGSVAGAVAKMQAHVIVFSNLREELINKNVAVDGSEAVLVLPKLIKLEAALLEAIPAYCRVASRLREINEHSRVAREFDRMAAVTEQLYRLVLDLHHFLIGAENTIGRSWEAAVAASRVNFQAVTASFTQDEDESDPELLALAAQIAVSSEDQGSINDSKWAKNLAGSPLH